MQNNRRKRAIVSECRHFVRRHRHGKHIDIFGIDGVLLRSVVSAGDIMSINLPSDAVYIVKSQDSTTKVRL